MSVFVRFPMFHPNSTFFHFLSFSRTSILSQFFYSPSIMESKFLLERCGEGNEEGRACILLLSSLLFMLMSQLQNLTNAHFPFRATSSASAASSSATLEDHSHRLIFLSLSISFQCFHSLRLLLLMMPAQPRRRNYYDFGLTPALW